MWSVPLAASSTASAATNSNIQWFQFQGKLATFTVDGPNLDKGISFNAPSCSGIAEVVASAAPTQKVYTCTPAVTGPMTVAVVGDGVVLRSMTVTLAVPTGAQLLRDFMRDFVKQQQEASEHDAWFRREVQIGIDAADAGAVVAAEEVEAEAQAWRAETRRKMAGASLKFFHNKDEFSL